jgi:hypothetical protein
MLGASAGDWCGSSRLIPFGRPVVPDEYAAMHGGTKPKEAETPPPKRRSATGSPDRRRDDALTMGALDLAIEADGFDERDVLADHRRLLGGYADREKRPDAVRVLDDGRWCAIVGGADGRPSRFVYFQL